MERAPIYSFTGGADGSSPSVGSLLLDTQGNLYGVTPGGGGGIFPGGVLYELSRSGETWNESVLYTFCGELDCLDGYSPYAGLISDAAGNLYGTTVNWRFGAGGVVYELSAPGGSGYQLLLNFSFSNAGLEPYGSLIFAPGGQSLRHDVGRGANGAGTVFELTPFGNQWHVSVLYAFGGTGLGPLGGLLLDGHAICGALRMRRMRDAAMATGTFSNLRPSQGSWIYTDVYDFRGANDGGNPIGSLIIDSSGNIYGTAMRGGAHGSGVVFEVTP